MKSVLSPAREHRFCWRGSSQASFAQLSAFRFLHVFSKAFFAEFLRFKVPLGSVLGDDFFSDFSGPRRLQRGQGLDFDRFAMNLDSLLGPSSGSLLLLLPPK